MVNTQSPNDWPDELFHYTDINGLKGILGTQTLWATHYAYLNDSQEIKHFFEEGGLFSKIMKDIVLERVNEVIQEPRVQSEIYKCGGKTNLVNHDANLLLQSLRNSFLEKNSENALYTEAYIACFSKPKNKKISEHGLLSQWYMYGKNEGYAIVFSKQGIKTLFGIIERPEISPIPMVFGDVVYSDFSNSFKKEFEKELKTIRDFYKGLFLDKYTGEENYPELSQIYDSILYCACRYKHWGFKEENEMRIVAVPISKEKGKIYTEEGYDFTNKTIELRTNKAIPYIKLFDDIELQANRLQRLPIIRIIIGPSPTIEEKRKRVRAVEIFLEQLGLDDIEVTASDIPFLG